MESAKDSPKVHPAALAARKANSAVLKAGYSSTKRAVETVSVYSFIFLVTYSAIRLSIFLMASPWYSITILLTLASFASMLVADFSSGVVHWAADTWGSVNTPFFKTFIRSFREHHANPVEITNHDWIETNGDNCMATIPILAYLSFGMKMSASYADTFGAAFFLLLCFWVSLTNQIHKWAHTYKPSTFVTLLQQYHIILPKSVHALHHRPPFDREYCITNGWLNGILTETNFWKRLEVHIIAWTGAVPRQDDKMWTLQEIDPIQ